MKSERRTTSHHRGSDIGLGEAVLYHTDKIHAHLATVNTNLMIRVSPIEFGTVSPWPGAQKNDG